MSAGALTFNALTFSGTGTKTLVANTVTTATLSLNNGGLDIGSGRTYSWGAFSSAVATARTLSLNDNIVNLTANGALWSITPTNLTFSAGTSSIRFTNTTNNANSFTGGGLTYNNVWFNRGTSVSAITIAGSNTFADFRDSGTAAHSLLFTAGTTNTFTTFTVSGTSAATYALVKAGGGTVNSDYLNIQHSVASPANSWYAGPGSINNQGVATVGSGWIIYGFNALFMSGD